MFTKMSDGTKEEWEHISQEHAPHIMDMPTRVIEMLKQLEGLSLGFGTNQLHHALQTATMAKRAGAEDEMVLISLIHDMGKVVNVPNHGQICAEIIKPYVSDDAYNIIRTHQDFQGEHYYHYLGKPRDLRKNYENESWYEKAKQFTDEWDQAAFDPEYDTEPLEYFIPLIQKFFSFPKDVWLSSRLIASAFPNQIFNIICPWLLFLGAFVYVQYPTCTLRGLLTHESPGDMEPERPNDWRHRPWPRHALLWVVRGNGKAGHNLRFHREEFPSVPARLFPEIPFRGYPKES